MSDCTDEEILSKVESSLKFQMDHASVRCTARALTTSLSSVESMSPGQQSAKPSDKNYPWTTPRTRSHAGPWPCGVQPRLVQVTEHATMKAAVEVFNGRLTDKELPSKSLVAQKLEQVEDNAPYAEDMRDVTSVEDAESEAYNAVIDPSAAVLRIKPGRAAATPPGTPEELRLRHRRIGRAWEMVRAKPQKITSN